MLYATKRLRQSGILNFIAGRTWAGQRNLSNATSVRARSYDILITSHIWTLTSRFVPTRVITADVSSLENTIANVTCENMKWRRSMCVKFPSAVNPFTGVTICPNIWKCTVVRGLSLVISAGRLRVTSLIIISMWRYTMPGSP